jgi:hypothetical protein
MLSLTAPGKTRLCDGVTRREILRVGGLGALGLTLPAWQQAEAAGIVRQAAAKAKSVILIFNCGAPSHIDLWDLKPDAPDDVRGPYKPIATNVDGIRIGELLPELAKRADMYSIVRTVSHKQSSHNAGMYWTITGKPYPQDSTIINPARSDHPSFGTLTGWLARKEGYRGAIPPYVITPAPHCDSTVYLTPGQYGSQLGPEYDPFVLNSDPNKKDFKVPNLDLSPGVTVSRMEKRRGLLESVDQALRDYENTSIDGLDGVQQKAFSLVTSSEVRKAFDLTQEPDNVRDRYGRHTWGQSHLLARRLVEAGSKFVTTVNGQSIIWDTHKDNFNLLKNRLVPPMERAFVALLDDLKDRGLFDSTLVVWMGDFGRTPKINRDTGRDHWPPCNSIVLAGGGIRGGTVVGSSDRLGAYPDTRPTTPADIHATVFKLLGYDPHATMWHSFDDRPLPLSEGTPIHELL